MRPLYSLSRAPLSLSLSCTHRLPQTLYNVGMYLLVYIAPSSRFPQLQGGEVEPWLGIDSEGLWLPLGFPTDPGWARWVWAMAACYNSVVHWGAIRDRAQAI